MDRTGQADIAMPLQMRALRRTVAAQMCNYRERLAANIKRERTVRGQSTMDVAYAIGVDKRTYERWEEAKVDPRPGNLRSLADQWAVDVTQLKPDLAAEEAQLDRIENGLKQLLDHFDIGELEEIADDGGQETGQESGQTGERPG